MATTEPDAAESGAATQPLTRIANILGACLIGMAVTALLLWMFAAGMQMGGGGVFYLVAFLVATVMGYAIVKQATEVLPWLRIAIILAALAGFSLVSLNWRRLGFEDPFVAPAVIGIFVMLAYFFTPGAKAPEAEAFEETSGNRLAATEAAGEAPALADAVPVSVTFFRKSSMMGMGVCYHIDCDGRRVADIDNGRLVTVQIPAGDHQFTLTDDYGTGPGSAIGVNLKPDEEAFIDCSFRSLWKGVDFRQVDRAEAEREMEGLSAGM